ncbi:hypothetical protein ACDF64_07530 [Agromyces sp. MMS24-JH15]|uniref:hypothetical protein n=1 Tax=Agromyces sp. MMS24-JH15 TaxID=3243765 RepID=UPI00374A29FD
MRRPGQLPAPFDRRAFAVAEARAVGLTERRMRARDLDAPFHGVRVATAPTNLLDRCRSYAVAMDPHSAFSHATAATLHGIPLPWAVERDPRLHVVSLVGGRAARGRGIAGHSTTARPLVARIGGLPVLSATDAWCSLGTMLQRDDLIAAGDRLLGLPDPLATPDDIDQAIERHGRRPGAGRLRLARSALRSGSFSRRESLTRLRLLEAGVPEPELNTVIELRSGRMTRGDLVFRAYRVLVEYDGEHHLLDARQWAVDVARHNDLVADGWIVIRVTKQSPSAELVARVVRALSDRGWRR